jgi:hypothetical protein
MVRYLSEFEYTPQAFASFLKSPSDRFAALAPLYAANHCKLEAMYLAEGSSTAFTIITTESVESAEALSMAILATGMIVGLKSTPILTTSEAVEAMRKASSVLYKPPTG